MYLWFLVLGFALIVSLGIWLLFEYKQSTEKTQNSWYKASADLQELTLITGIFETQNLLQHHLQATMEMEFGPELNAVFREIAKLREKIVSARNELYQLPLSDEKKAILDSQNEVFVSGFEAQMYYENMLLELEDREEALKIIRNGVAIMNQRHSQNLFGQFYYKTHDNLLLDIEKYTDFSIEEAKQIQFKLGMNVLLILLISIIVILGLYRRDKKIELQTEELTRNNDTLEKTVVERTEHLEEAKKSAQDASLAKSEFLAIMSHEIRTPLNGMIGSLNLINLDALSEDEKYYLKTAQTSSDLLLAVINDILDFSKIESGKFSLVLRSIDLQQELRSIEELYKPLVEEKGLKFQMDLSGLTDHWLLADSLRISQILNNFMNNALKFTDIGSIKLSVFTMEDSRISFSVQDSGIGIPSEKIHLLFHEFSQIHQGSDRAYEGTGLGLIICKRLAQLMDGDVFVESDENIGSKFSAVLKLESISEKQYLDEHKKNKDFVPVKEVDKNVSVLLVEDNSINQMVISRFLELSGYQVTIAGNGAEALYLLEDSTFSVIFMDCQMPVMDGFEATRLIRKKGDKTPIIALTANVQDSDREKCSAAGMNDFLMKPFQPKVFKETLQKYL